MGGLVGALPRNSEASARSGSHGVAVCRNICGRVHKPTKKRILRCIVLVGMGGLVGALPRNSEASARSGSHGVAVCRNICGRVHKPTKKRILRCIVLVGMGGLEPLTPTLSGWCSNRLSYIPIFLRANRSLLVVVEIHGFEPRTS